jgi:hypothetical protein
VSAEVLQANREKQHIQMKSLSKKRKKRCEKYPPERSFASNAHKAAFCKPFKFHSFASVMKQAPMGFDMLAMVCPEP